MNSLPVSRAILAKPFHIVMWIALAIVVIKAVVLGLDMHENFASRGNDDIMRLLSVRDWLAGQDWYDMTQYRLVPPDGVSVHWSRYIDLGIAAIIVPLSYFVPMDTAEQLAVSIWPTLIAVINLLVIGFGTRRVFGAYAACFAVMCTLIWPLTGDLHSRAGNLDHHNVQMLMMTIVAFAVVWPSRPIVAGIVGGLAAAFSLTIGLESLPFIVVAGVVLLLRALWVGTPAVRQLLVAFCVALGLGSVLFWLGQTPPNARLNPVCDQLGAPMLSLIGIAAVASILPMMFGRRFAAPVPYLIATATLTAIGIGFVWPLLSICLEGPYGQVPSEQLELIVTRITEAKPGLVYMQGRPDPFLVFVLPVFAVLVFGAIQWAADRKTPQRSGFRNQTLGLLLILCLGGATMIFVQMRTVILAASVVPIIGGFMIARQLDAYLEDRTLMRGLLGLVLAVMIISPTSIVAIVRPVLPASQFSDNNEVADCRRYESLINLNEVPPAVILNQMNFGPSLIWATHHAALSAPYHRSAKSLTNGVVPFQLEDPELAAYVRETGATHLLLCRGHTYESTLVTALAAGGTVDWLRLVPVSDENQLLFEVLP